ncbi:aldehyde dehydrogenase [Xanthobacter dioxanivorans]|uniref:Aldehyde dehydrogenase n=1 Tax=Xanthobacter dioxanivorans TaxID=2528964 RepID=A0A974PPW8_9HYPH|nr:aldehyde dehydrogenase [Xanthobacter dioxanivorans]QRG07572.1 aldehyde dehydrogenase [Xanthobacter dioxanivorans]
MAEMIVVTEENRDDMSRKAGIFLYSETRLWLEDDSVHRADGPALLSPDGVERWYVRGAEVTRAVKAFFAENKWTLRAGLDSDEKRDRFAAQFLG